ncbi:MAG: hypothetical protein GF364_09585 [Candidatus Lokiarchaeota archaeon]|nr:hypothetical protein [Candidatus Lokiarchaeota archaeon]
MSDKSKEEMPGLKKWGVYPNPSVFKQFSDDIDQCISKLELLKRNGMMSEFKCEIIQGMINTLKSMGEMEEQLFENDPLYQSMINKSNIMHE